MRRSSLRPDMRLPVLAARAKRVVHILGYAFRPWLWEKRGCCNFDCTSEGPPDYRQQVLLIACFCGREFYRDPEYDQDGMEEFKRLIH